MSEDKCRLCLSNDNLISIFVNKEQSERYSLVLALTTGLKITINDGLPQQICSECTKLVNSALNLRNVAHRSEIKLIKSGFERITENTAEESNTSNPEIQCNEDLECTSKDYFDFNGFHYEIEIDIGLENGGLDDVDIDSKKGGKVKEKKDEKVKVKSCKERREVYLRLIDGKFNRNGPVTCKVCGKTVGSWGSFINHAKLHLGFKFICEFCGKGFISSNQLNRHCRSFHGLERDLKCRHCSYLALDNAQLTVHVRRMHTGERPYVCDICAAAYFNRKCLLQHIESHRDTASVQCEHCPLLFKSSRHLAKHRYNSHGDRGRSRRRQKRLLEQANLLIETDLYSVFYLASFN